MKLRINWGKIPAGALCPFSVWNMNFNDAYWQALGVILIKCVVVFILIKKSSRAELL